MSHNRPIARHSLVRVDTVCRFCGGPFLKVIVTGCSSTVRLDPCVKRRSFSYRDTISTAPGDIVLLADNNGYWNRCERNVDLSEDSGQKRRACDQSGKELHLCPRNNSGIVEIYKVISRTEMCKEYVAEEFALNECGCKKYEASGWGGGRIGKEVGYLGKATTFQI